MHANTELDIDAETDEYDDANDYAENDANA
jgi:hypothetical protein